MEKILTDNRLPRNISVEKHGVIINSSGVHTSDKKGNRYYRGRLQANVRMTSLYFSLAQKFWANQTLNGQPLKLVELQVVAGANSTIPYNSPTQRRMVPQIVPRDESNRVGWYNVKFDNCETGWICNNMYFSAADAAHGIAVDTVYQIYNDKKVIACIQSRLSNQR